MKTTKMQYFKLTATAMFILYMIGVAIFGPIVASLVMGSQGWVTLGMIWGGLHLTGLTWMWYILGLTKTQQAKVLGPEVDAAEEIIRVSARDPEADCECDDKECSDCPENRQTKPSEDETNRKQ